MQEEIVVSLSFKMGLAKQEINVFIRSKDRSISDLNLIDNYKVKTEDISQALKDILRKFYVQKIILFGNASYLSKYAVEIKRYAEKEDVHIHMPKIEIQ